MGDQKRLSKSDPPSIAIPQNHTKEPSKLFNYLTKKRSKSGIIRINHIICMRSAAGCWLTAFLAVSLFCLALSGSSSAAQPSTNEPPIAIIEAIVPFPPAIDSTLTFKGAGSDTDGTIDRYVWDFDDGSTQFNSSATGITNHVYSEPGNYYPELRVQDSSGAWSQPAIATLFIPATNPAQDEADTSKSFYGAFSPLTGAGALLAFIVTLTVVRGLGRRRSRSKPSGPELAPQRSVTPATPVSVGESASFQVVKPEAQWRSQHGTSKVQVEMVGRDDISGSGSTKEEFARPPTPTHSPISSRSEVDDTLVGYSAVNYEKAHVVYKVKVDNKAPYPLSEVRVRPYFDGHLFAPVDKEERTIALLKRGEAKTVTFHLRPKGECGNTSLAARVTYYDTKKEKHKDIEVKPRETTIVCPLLKYEEVDEKTWRRNVADMMKVEETTDKIPMDGRSLFQTVTGVLQDLNLCKVNAILVKGRVFRARTKFWAKGAVESKGLGYAANVEVIGGERRSKLILQAYTRNEESLIGFYHRLLDEIEKRISVRDYLDDDVTIHHIHGDVHGDVVSGTKVEVKDSVVSRSNIGGKRYD